MGIIRTVVAIQFTASFTSLISSSEETALSAACAWRTGDYSMSCWDMARRGDCYRSAGVCWEKETFPE
jgi:hypothetical protein